MATLMAGLTLSKVLTIAGTVVSAVGAIQQGKAQQSAADYQAKQLEAKASTDRALAQRQAEEDRRQTELVQSRARAVGAASGGGLDIKLAGDLEEEGEYRALTSLWEGEEAARGREQQAKTLRYEGRLARQTAGLKATKSILGGASSLYEKYS